MLLKQDTNGHDVLKIFDDGVTIDQKLPKWVNASARIAEKKKESKSEEQPQEAGNTIVFRQSYYTESGTSSNMNPTPMTTQAEPFVVYTTPEHYEVKKDVCFDKVAAANLKELTEMIKSNELNNVLSGYGGMVNSFPIEASGNSGWKEPSAKGLAKLFRAIGDLFEKKVRHYQFDATQFFTQVKLTSKTSAQNYRDRVSKYLQAIHNANAVGQTALVETLLKGLIANKYESLLFSTGKYYVVTEEQVVDFAKRTERGVDLTYVKNFVRPIPTDVINKIAEANDLEVFDNYVIMHYDPKKVAHKETEKEIAKRKDPIVFGLISGSRKLYYITDWIDESCDLTLEKFVDTLGVDKEDLLDGDANEQQKATDTKKATKKSTKKTTKKVKK